MRRRPREALRRKARRGGLFLTVAVGHVTVRHDRIARRPDRRDREDWDVSILDHHEGHVSRADVERAQRLIADNANCRGQMARGSVRRGDARLAGCLRCGHCGGRLHVSCSGTDGFCVRSSCRGAHITHGTQTCIAVGGMRVEAALAAVAPRDAGIADTRRQAELALVQARLTRRISPAPRTTRSIPRTAWSPPSSKAAGTTGSGRYGDGKSGAPPLARASPR